MSKKIAFIFPGQGCQYPQMGKDFYENFSIVKQTFQEASDVLKLDVKKLILESSEQELTLTSACQIAVFVVSSSFFRVVQQQFPELTLNFCAGLSLGEYTALYASGRISFEECLKLVRTRGRLMHDVCLKFPGRMSVISGMEIEKIQNCLIPNVWIANLNCPGQVVIAGTTDALERVEEILKKQGAKKIFKLDVSGAFHTPLMEQAQQKLSPYLLSVPLYPSSIQFIMNKTGEITTDVEKIRENLVQQIVSPTLWEKSIRTIQANAADVYIEIGPGRTLTGINRKMDLGPVSLSISKIEDLIFLEDIYAVSPQR